MLTAKVTTTICSGPAVHLRLPQKWNVDFKGTVYKGENYREINNSYNGLSESLFLKMIQILPTIETFIEKIIKSTFL